MDGGNDCSLEDSSNLALHRLFAAMAMWASSPARADSAYDPIIAHLDFLGYQSDVVDQGVRARHSSKLHIVVSYQKGGILVQTAFQEKALNRMCRNAMQWRMESICGRK
jgi:hypothetical protein